MNQTPASTGTSVMLMLGSVVLFAANALLIRGLALALPAAPTGQFYARVDGRIVLVDVRTELPVRVVRAG